ncbi:hypothetical protein [Schnuerera sp.]|uniref:hypothetical protein n=1 Tax=Schnuerera sp. TaxID=2794844 RepID=UPI002B85F2E4|nr:hypothetical protein [Schnuerera sp.]HSH35517.1 hypothetical protein [Schnuerera sp.]
MAKLVMRSKKKAFMEVETGNFERMKGFTALTTNKNPAEYTRKYVDESFETTDIVGMSTSIDYEFDQMLENAVHDKIIDITESEKLGDDAVVSILVVDFTQSEVGGGYRAVKRDFAVVPSTDGDGTNAYQYAGTFRVKGERVEGVATSEDDFEKTCTFVADGAGI